jgi:hypothetical protein
MLNDASSAFQTAGRATEGVSDGLRLPDFSSKGCGEIHCDPQVITLQEEIVQLHQ